MSSKRRVGLSRNELNLGREPPKSLGWSDARTAIYSWVSFVSISISTRIVRKRIETAFRSGSTSAVEGPGGGEEDDDGANDQHRQINPQL